MYADIAGMAYMFFSKNSKKLQHAGIHAFKRYRFTLSAYAMFYGMREKTLTVYMIVPE